MRKLLLLGCLAIFPLLSSLSQDAPAQEAKNIRTPDFVLRPNSRDYHIVRKGNNHQRLLQIRKQALLRNKQALINRKMAMERRRVHIQQQLLRQQNLRQRMIRQNGKNR